MKVILRKRNGKFIDYFDISPSTTVDQFKELFYKKYHYYPERQKWNLDNATGKTLISGTLSEVGIKDGDILIFKDLGVQISWRLVYVIEYLGPILIFPFFYFCDKYIYSHNAKNKHIIQILSLWFLLFHFLKREFESLFVHRFSNATMPIVRVPINCGHYWILCGVNIGYYLFHPKYKPHNLCSKPHIVYSIFFVLLVLEFLNLKCHLILKNLRPRGTKTRGIPYGYGFNYISCANYFYESLIWIIFSLITNTLTGYIFCCVAIAQMAIWALKKHNSYKKEFPNYPKNRKAIFPFVL
ncbi:3-oxo-5-alpha-steroid 4-dehydrogenase, putative [Plasmodium berghei]|uniref:3-oxo-5-alpha-steroid 4-dehydrogenase, putative n=2 Tax=Plasmodium berghei TaxID=5821 RepID=A0A509AIE2_PLABA|nr:3-oxo-5-alpha-steroid 4-dehydrogenase, putative [Plasmodium berghei ANKA]SCM21927.1 3-oxo-5-alpha-steroid 4-dehydrogenase, putative [Plasmodium berghei]SCN25168.1 3-oxo-5-alpha-steroid 4-dehydrogenase, putative [Plasmodium berghei]SCO60172.1 3-oxo-5-alpha-steroid 4-dehydrogenase, putative [Plasmodium berghei]SCO61759.1 3-oxo-5-alpha-steroid 4-dehydrogenase, putative [Plasmodium berghei]VUC55668.1 3-oxo-5-alpha-steroid 4-dehydrogenase, putative [Plasmodium berghei ANKA]|eukprot:XP_034421478.1 3-oxo-5-alpha-steroid 4-dehydrogenase, putative [Plasmodium berghei ANKA]